MRETLREHCAEHFPDVQAPSRRRRRAAPGAAPAPLAAETKRAVAGLSTNCSVSPALGEHVDAPALLAHRHHRAPLEAAAEMCDARLGADSRDRTRGAEHESMLGPARARRPPGAIALVQHPRRSAVTATVAAMRRTKIVATIGPASREPDTLLRMIEAGMDVARLNYSHGTLDEHAETVRRVRDAAGRAGRPVAILQDLPGPKLRIGPLREDIVELTPGERLTFSAGGEEVEGDATRMSVSWQGLADALEKDAIAVPGRRIGAPARGRRARRPAARSRWRSRSAARSHRARD